MNCFSVWGFTVNLLNLLKYGKYFEFSFINPAKSIGKQLTQLFSHMCIQAFTDYWGVKASGQLGHMS